MDLTARNIGEARSLIDEWHKRASMAKPFLKWAGGKRIFLTRPEARELLPPPRGRFIEPFVGSAAVFFSACRRAGRPIPAQLGDANRPLIECFWQVQKDPAAVWDALKTLIAGFRATDNRRRFYERTREHYNALLPRIDAADFIFLNRTCWNGLYRENSRGHFNVPIGRVAEEKRQTFPDEEDLLNAAVAFSNARMRATSWEHTIALAEEGDFVFLDPPYFSESFKRIDTKYVMRPFGFEDHQKLANELARLRDRGVDFVLTNSAERKMQDLYKAQNLRVRVISIPRAINSDTANRASVRELVVTPA